MKPRFTEHARLRLNERNITVQEVERIILNPKWEFYDLKRGYKVAIGEREKEGHYLIVVYEFHQELIEVVTVIDISRRLEKVIKKRVENKRWVEL